MIVYLASKEASDSAKCVSPNLTDLIRGDQKMGAAMLKRKRLLVLSILWWVEASCKDLCGYISSAMHGFGHLVVTYRVNCIKALRLPYSCNYQLPIVLHGG